MPEPRQTSSFALKFVIDSNVWIDAVTAKNKDRKSACNQAIDRARSSGTIIGDNRTFNDLVNAIRMKLIDKRDIKKADADKLFEKYKKLTLRVREKTDYIEYVKTHKEQLSKCDDKDDYPFLVLAHEQGASYIITNDRKHLACMREYMGTKIVAPQEFLQEQQLL